MPITQERLKSIADAGESISSVYIGVCYQIRQLIRQHNLGAISTEEALDSIFGLVSSPEAGIVRETLLISRELIRWQFSHVKNEQEARRLARRRAENPSAPVPERLPVPPNEKHQSPTRGRLEQDPDYQSPQSPTGQSPAFAPTLALDEEIEAMLQLQQAQAEYEALPTAGVTKSTVKEKE